MVHPPKVTKKSKPLSQDINKYDNILIAGNFNIDISNVNDEATSYFPDSWDTFNLKKPVIKSTCYKSLKSSIINLILTNKPRSCQKNSVCETGLSDCHKTIFVKKLPPKQITNRRYKSFNKTKFCYDLDKKFLKGEKYSHDIKP